MRKEIYGFGEVPIEVEEFLSLNHLNLRGIIGSGNRNWGSNYCRSAYILSERYSVPLLMTFEMSGTRKDVIKFQEILEKQGLIFK